MVRYAINASDAATIRSVMWQCRSKLATIGTSGPTTARTADNSSPSGSSSVSVADAPWSERYTPSRRPASARATSTMPSRR